MLLQTPIEQRINAYGLLEPIDDDLDDFDDEEDPEEEYDEEEDD